MRRAALVVATEEITVAELVTDPNRFEVRWRGQRIRLAPTAFLILAALARNPGAVKTCDQLLNAAGDEGMILDRTIDSHIKRTRRKFKAADPSFDRIETVYGVGYRWRDEA